MLLLITKEDLLLLPLSLTCFAFQLPKAAKYSPLKLIRISTTAFNIKDNTSKVRKTFQHTVIYDMTPSHI